MRGLQEYFDLISRLVEHSGAKSIEVEFNQDPVTGKVKGVLYFYDSSRLEFAEAVIIERYRPVRLAYRYQYIRAGETVFRYDNARHHPGLPNFPHHQHVGNERLSAIEPTLSQVLNEVASLLGEETPPPLTPRRRRRARR